MRSYEEAWLERPAVAIAHDYLTQRGGAERVVLAMIEAFPGAPVFTTVFDPSTTFDAFASADVRTSPLQRVGFLRRHHRAAFPALAWATSRLHVDADVVVCSSSGWAHGIPTEGRKIVYCHNPARWLYQGTHYLGEHPNPLVRVTLDAVRPALARWDRTAAQSAHRYLANSTAVRDRIHAIYGIDAEVLAPPHAADPSGVARPLHGIEPGFILCVGRLLPYKNVGKVINAFAELPGHRLVVAGSGPREPALRALAATMSNVTFLGHVAEDTLRWLYASCAALVTASHEDFGLTPLEAAAFGKPTAALRYGGFLDTIVEGVTGVLFDEPRPPDIADAVRRLTRPSWDAGVLRTHADRYAVGAFVESLQKVVAEEQHA